jgi:hypothetical protein
MARFPDRRLARIIAPVGDAEPATYTCGVCGFVMNEVGECPRCKLAVEGAMEEADDGGEDLLREVREIVDRVDRAQRGSRA